MTMAKHVTSLSLSLFAPNPNPAGFSYSNCQYHYGEYGEHLSCPEFVSGGEDDVVQNTVVESICGSGRDDDCSGYSHMVSQCRQAGRVAS